jgi:2-methylcitrate dehydratase PrpD
VTPLAFIHALRFEHLPAPVVALAKRCLLDLVGVAAAGLRTELSRIVRDHAVRHMGASEGGARILLDGRRASPAGAAYAGASTIDAFDAHDGHPLTKGHAGVAVLPALLAVSDAEGLGDGGEFLTALVLGYEVAIRAGMALHGSVPDYHTSGAWNALGCAAVAARVLRLDGERTRHALGVAEYHGPRSQMMRCIDHPTMLKDGSGWGAFAGVSAAYLAADGFTGAPAITVEGPEQAELWSDLGRCWRMLEIYLKPQPVCRWAQPAIEAALALVKDGRIQADRIESIRVETFDAAVRLGTRPPMTTEEAQYGLGFPLAAAIARGRVSAEEITGDGLRNSRILSLLSRIEVVERPHLTRRFPAERAAVVSITLEDGTVLSSEPTGARGDADAPLGEAELRAKFALLAQEIGSDDRAAIEAGIDDLPACRNLDQGLFELLLAAPRAVAGDERGRPASKGLLRDAARLRRRRAAE